MTVTEEKKKPAIFSIGWEKLDKIGTREQFLSCCKHPSKDPKYVLVEFVYLPHHIEYDLSYRGIYLFLQELVKRGFNFLMISNE